MRTGLAPFVAAQDPVWPAVMAELRQGQKTSHWMWFVFPQLRGLGQSERAVFYGLTGCDQARDYAAHPVLGPRLTETHRALLGHSKSAEAILGDIDAQKLRSSTTLFQAATGDPLFGEVLARFFTGPCPMTGALLAR